MNSLVKKLLLQLLLLVLFSQSFAAMVDTVITYSAAMKKNIKAVVIKPDNYTSGNHFPVLYLLHGYGGNQADWISKVPAITQYADQYQLIIVCPDGNIGSWYFDSPVDSSWKYETYISKELIGWVDDHFTTIKSRTGRAITGLSMGGHGALYLAFKHQEMFGAAGSMSGGVDITPFPNNWDISKRLGAYALQAQRWENNTVINLTHLLTPNSLTIIFDCGTDDFFYSMNVKLHEKLMYSNIPHDFISRPGGHTWEYWSNSISYQLLFFNKYFIGASKQK